MAPTESGAQILRVPENEFHARCLKTPGITAAQAEAFRSKMWQMHIDSQRAVDEAVSGSTANMSSRDLQGPTASTVPFKERIRPGMVVSWKEPSEQSDGSESLKLAVVLAPRDGTNGFNRFFKDGTGAVKEREVNTPSYLCALVVPGVMADAYEVHLWRQVVVGVNTMEKEVGLEYDAATRYYYVSV